MKDPVVPAELEQFYDKISAGERLSMQDGLFLYDYPNLLAVGYLANLVKKKKQGNKTYYVKNQHINYTNVCNKFCKFCSFYVIPRSDQAYTLSIDEVCARVRRYRDAGVKEIHMVGGIYPKISYDYYLDLISAIKSVYPDVYLKAFTMAELLEIARVGKKAVPEVVLEMKTAGLDMFTGGGVEVLSDRVHQLLFPMKIGPTQWLELSRTCHRLGVRSNATLLYGHIETVEEKVQHLIKLRELQGETDGFLSYIPLSFHPEGTQLGHLPAPTGSDDLREIAVGRLMLDNFQHIKTFWVMSSIPVSQLALQFGADDIDGTIMRYEITKDQSKGVDQAISETQLLSLISELGLTPIERDPLYRKVN